MSPPTDAALALLESKYESKRLDYLFMMGLCVGLISVLGAYGLFEIVVGVDDLLTSDRRCKTAKCLAEDQAGTA